MRAFAYEGLPARVVFGQGSIARLREMVAAVGGSRALLLSTARQADNAAGVCAAAGAPVVGHFAGAIMHTPIEVTERALAELERTGADSVISFGGGSTIGLGKALALRTDVPQVAVATTYAGSEMTPVLGETDAGRKTTQRSPRVLPEAVIYDVDLTLGLRPEISVTSGLNAMAHAVEGLYARDTNPVMQLMAEEAVRVLAHNLPLITVNPACIEARSETLYAAWLCGMVLGSTGMALHHKLCHILGGTFDLPHAETHSVILPHALAFNAPAVPHAMTALTRAFDGSDPIASLAALVHRIGAPTALRDIGMPQDGIEAAADQAVENPYWNPRKIDRESVRLLIERAYLGKKPEA